MASKSDKMYANSPKMERDDEGKMAVKKRADKDYNETVIGDGEDVEARQTVERRALKHKHIKEHHDFFHKHEQEHAAYKGKDKAELHKRHYAELKAMHAEHENEHKAMYARHEKELHGKKIADQNLQETINADKNDKE